jgi:hypothetical protein
MRIASGVVMTAALILAGCTSTPAGRITYFFPKAITQLTVIQTLSCDAKLTTLHQVLTVTPTTSYVSDPSNHYEIEPNALGGGGADKDLTLQFTEDGRLTGVNFVTAGQGGAILKDVLAIAKIAVALASTPADASYDPQAACKVVSEEGVKEKDGPAVLTLKFLADFEYGELAGSTTLGIRAGRKDPATNQVVPFTNEIIFRVDPASRTVYDKLGKHIPKLTFTANTQGTLETMKAPVWSDTPKAPNTLKLNRVGLVDLEVKGPVGDLKKADIVWSGQIAVPLTRAEADFFYLPIPQAQLFGNQTFALSLSPAGSITKLQYASSGAAQASGAAASLAGFVGELAAKPTPAEEAAKIKAEADLIYQQQRLALCIATPAACVVQ